MIKMTYHVLQFNHWIKSYTESSFNYYYASLQLGLDTCDYG